MTASIQVSAAMFRKGWAKGEALPESEVPVDPALPELATMLDGEAMGPILADSLPDGLAERWAGSGRCGVAGVRYRPGRECLVSYVPDGRDGGRSGRPIACAKVMTAELAERRLAGARDRGVSLVHLPERGMVLTAFPHDLRVPGLRDLMEVDRLTSILRTALDRPEAALLPAEDGSPEARIVSYRPERSCLLRCVVRGAGAPGSDPRTIFARLYRDDRGAVIHRAMTALWNGAARASGALSVAEPLGYDPATRVLCQGAVAGRPLAEVAGSAEYLDRIGLVARSLGALHGVAPHLERQRRVEDELDWIRIMARGLHGVRPAAGEELLRVLDRLWGSRPRDGEAPRCLIHGDFSMSQVLVDESGPSLIDFDDVALGDPHADLGTFLARLEGRIADPETRRTATERFRRDYQAASAGDVSWDRVTWYQALGFVRLALSALGQLRPGWPSRLAGHLHRAETMFDHSATTAHPHALAR